MRRVSVRQGCAAALVASAGLGLVTGALLMVRPASVYGVITGIVVVDDPLRPSDMIYVLNGRVGTRAAEAAEVFHGGFAPNIRLAHTREMARRPDRPLSELIAAEIVERNVPGEAVSIVPYPGGVVDTRDEARALRSYLEANPARRVIVVTTDHHTGRARRVLRQELRGLDVELLMSAAPDDRALTPENWWQTEFGRRVYGEELLKQIGSVLLYWTGNA